MTQVSAKLRAGPAGYFTHWCPACEEAHQYGPRWTFNGNVDTPSFSPSMKITWGRYADPNHKAESPDENRICHYFLTDGELRFCGDCTHSMGGRTVPLPDLPEHMQGDNWSDG
jgi:hypothetical protein